MGRPTALLSSEEIEVRKAKARVKWASRTPEEKRALRDAARGREEARAAADPIAEAERLMRKSQRATHLAKQRREAETLEAREARLAKGREREANRMRDATTRAARLEAYTHRNGALGRWESAARTFGVDIFAMADRCEICGDAERLCVDHHHGSGAVRGTLCTRCNTAIGMFRDCAAVVLAAATYLATHGDVDHRIRGPGFHPLVRSAVARKLLTMSLEERLRFELEAERDGAPIRARGRRVRTYSTAVG